MQHGSDGKAGPTAGLGSPSGPGSGTGTARTDRLCLLAALDDQATDTDVLTAAAQHATAALGGFGAMGHLSASASRGLHLIASSGLPRAVTRNWEDIRVTDSVAPARAFRTGEFAFASTAHRPERNPSDPPHPSPAADVSARSAMAAVPLPGPDGPLGVLSVLLPVTDALSVGQRTFLREVGRWAAERLRLAPPTPDTVSRTLLGTPPERAPGQGPDVTSTEFEFEFDVQANEVVLDERLLDAVGIERETFDGRLSTFDDYVHPDDLPWVVGDVEQALRTRGRADSEYRVRRSDGTYAWVRFRGRAVSHRGSEPTRLVGTMSYTTETHAALESVGRALAHMSDGFLSVDRDGRIGFVNVAAERLFGRPRDLVGRSLWGVSVVRKVPLLEERSRRAVATGVSDGFEVPWPGTDRWYHLRLVPLADGLTLYITDVTERRLREAERAAAERAAAERAAVLTRLTRALAEATTTRDVTAAVAESVLPPLHATGLVILALGNERLDLVGSVGYPPAVLDRLHGMPVVAATPLGEVLRTRAPKFIESPDDLIAGHPGLVDCPVTEGKQAWVFVPLIVSGREIGVVVVSFDQPRHLTGDERSLLTVFGGQLAHTLERARQYDVATTRARDLQNALLPRALPQLPAITAAARYLPAGHGADIGGDWYDVIPLSGDRVALVIGDVMGHGMPEAATMGRLRTAVRTLSDLELPPDDVLTRLGDIVGELGEESFVTCLYGVYDPTTQILTYANAGHLPPVVARRDGTASLLTFDPDPPLGIAAPPFGVHDVSLPDGSFVVLYTDGLVETPGLHIDKGLRHLTETVAAALADRDGPAQEPDRLCDAVTTALLPAHRRTTDDTALLVARTRSLSPGDIATWALPEDPTAAGQARHHVHEQFGIWHLGEELEMATELIVSELVGNVIRHATGPIQLRLLRSRTLICEVTDGSLTTPHIRHARATDEGGRGLQLVAAMAQRWGTRYTLTGKCIWTEQALDA